ncbi:hypothetical protein BJ138DRAFT_1155140 [Hygrophoropsis aurantiaca]|uniref:Uncharacterized protein n=1 Tax=Hygrophoropsis aurantiaca TaxID=72124 RepID=A0ACB8A7U9_9AGAM|nr:hypothetical protein BJ138DRAFT_1155140 [Hygrophoropsis aurantiaca]
MVLGSFACFLSPRIPSDLCLYLCILEFLASLAALHTTRRHRPNDFGPEGMNRRHAVTCHLSRVPIAFRIAISSWINLQ